jgi:hypothetical protein
VFVAQIFVGRFFGRWTMRTQKRRLRTANKSRKLFPLALLWTYLALLGPAFGAETMLDGRIIRFEPPVGYCFLNAHNPRERSAIETLSRIQTPDSRLIWMFADCDELSLLRNGRTDRLTRYGQVLAVQPSGLFKPSPGMSRFEFANHLARNIPALDISRITRTAQSRVAAPDAPNQRLLHFGLATIDAAAAYAGLLVEENWGSARSVTAGMMAMTLVKDMPVAIALYSPYSELAAYRALRNELRPVVGNFLARNGSRADWSAPRTADAGSEDWENWLRRLATIDWNGALASGLLSIGFASIILVAARRFRSWR